MLMNNFMFIIFADIAYVFLVFLGFVPKSQIMLLE